MKSPQPIVAQPKPCLVKLRSGRAYLWCTCGRSARQPYCDYSHVGTAFEPLKYVARQDEEVLLCACKQSATPPFCDGAHANLPGGAPQDDPESPANRSIIAICRGAPRTELNGGCCVIAAAQSSTAVRGSLRYGLLVSPQLGSVHQSQHYLQVAGSASPIIGCGDRELILFVADGFGTIDISGRSFALQPTDGVYVRPSEGFQLIPSANSQLNVYALASPSGELLWLDCMTDNFDASFPQRVVSVDPAQRQAAGPRWFQCLVDKSVGSASITQFIGHIPLSKAAPHRHLYEETLIVLSGEGCMWTEELKTEVRAGDVIFLPQRQLHSLQSVSPEGMNVVGVICPGDNPRITYYD